MSPWIVVGIVVYWAVAFHLASRLGQWLKPPQKRPGYVEFLPTLGDAENARTRARGGRGAA